MCRPRIFKVWVRVLICFLLVSMIQPSLVLCLAPGGSDEVRCGPLTAPYGSASEASFSCDPLDRTCLPRADVPSSMADIGGKSSSPDPMGIVNGTPHTAKISSLFRILYTHSVLIFSGAPHRGNSRPESAHRNNSYHSTIRSTVLLI